MQTSAKLKIAGKKWNEIKSLTNPKKIRSIKFPIAPATTSERPIVSKKLFFFAKTKKAISAIAATSEIGIKIQDFPDKNENATPVFCV